MGEDGNQNEVDREQTAAQGRQGAGEIAGENCRRDAEQRGAEAGEKIRAEGQIGEGEQIDLRGVRVAGDEVDEEGDREGFAGGGARNRERVAGEPALQRGGEPAAAGDVAEEEVKRDGGREEQKRGAEAETKAGGEGEHTQRKTAEGQNDESGEGRPRAEGHRLLGEGAGLIAPKPGGETEDEQQDCGEGEES